MPPTRIRVLTPEDAEGRFLSIPVEGTPVPVVPPGARMVTYGHGWLAEGVGQVSTSNDYYARQVAAHFGYIYPTAPSGTAGALNRAVANSRAEDASLRAIGWNTGDENARPYQPGDAGVVIVQALRNSIGKHGNDTVAKRAAKAALRSLCAMFLAQSRIEDSDARFTYTGANWATDGSGANPNYSGGRGRYTTYNNQPFSFVVTEECYVILVGKNTVDGTGPVVTVTDTTASAVLATLNLAALATPSPDLPSQTHYAYKVPASLVGHTLSFAKTVAGSSLTFDVLLPVSSTPPTVVLVKEPYLATYGGNTSFPNGTDAAVDAFNALVDEVAAEFPNVRVADPASYGWSKATCLAPDGVNPNVAGWNVMAAAVIAVLQTGGSASTPGTAGLTRSEADTRYLKTTAPVVKVNEGPLSFVDPRVGGVADNSMSSPLDNAAALNAAYAMLDGKGGEIFVPRGVYPFRTAPNPQPGGVWLAGEGYDYSTAITPRPVRGSVFRALAPMAHLIRLGTNTGLTPGITAASMRGMSLDGNGVAAATLKAMGSRHRISHSQIYSGAEQAFYCAGQNVHAENCIFAQDDNGDVIFVAPGSNVIDNKIWTSQIRSPGATGAGIRIQSNAVDVQMNHLWAGGGGVAKPAQGLIVLEQGVGLTLITDNTIEGVLGPEIVFDGSGGVIYGTQVVGNKFYMNTGTEDITYPVMLFKAGGYSTFSIAGNMANANDATHRYKSFFDFDAGVTSLGGFVVGDNVGRFVAALTSGTLPSASVLAGVDYSNNQMHNGTAWKRTNGKGVATFTGDGTTTVFSIPHGLIASPAEAIVTAGSPAAAAASYTVWDAVNLTVTFLTAPADGATVKLNWRADC